MYLNETIERRDQNIRDNIPNIFASLRVKILLPIEKISRIAYRGLVPISPKTTPSAPKDKANIPALCFFNFI
jgi:hypothetical protein